MNISHLKKSKFITKNDVETPKLLTVRGLQEENVAMAEQAEEMKWCLFFEEEDKPMVLNPVNVELIGQFLGQETDDWIGKKIVLYFDPSIMFKGKLTGGIRVRAPKGSAKPAAAPSRPAPLPPKTAPATEPVVEGTSEEDENCPF